MKPSSRNILSLAVVAALTACAQDQADRTDRIDRFDAIVDTGEFPETWMDVTRQHMFIAVDGEMLNVNEVLKDEQKLLRALSQQFPSVAGPEERTDLNALITDIEDAFEDPDPESEAFRGFGRVLNRTFVDAARQTLNQEGIFDPRFRVKIYPSGQIIHYKFDQNNRSGEIHSISYLTVLVAPIFPNRYAGRNITWTDAVLWKVRVVPDPEVEDSGFQVVRRDDEHRDGPFPGTMGFTKAMINYIDFYEYEFKLWAEGTIIKIDEVHRKDDGESSFMLLDRDESEYDEIPSNCIDMLFQRPPPSRLGDMEPPSYCLGRCKSPGLVNTNAG